MGISTSNRLCLDCLKNATACHTQNHIHLSLGTRIRFPKATAGRPKWKEFYGYIFRPHNVSRWIARGANSAESYMMRYNKIVGILEEYNLITDEMDAELIKGKKEAERIYGNAAIKLNEITRIKKLVSYAWTEPQMLFFFNSGWDDEISHFERVYNDLTQMLLKNLSKIPIETSANGKAIAYFQPESLDGKLQNNTFFNITSVEQMITPTRIYEPFVYSKMDGTGSCYIDSKYENEIPLIQRGLYKIVFFKNLEQSVIYEFFMVTAFLQIYTNEVIVKTLKHHTDFNDETILDMQRMLKNRYLEREKLYEKFVISKYPELLV